MNELIKIENRNGIETVNARNLHEFLEVGKVFAAWIQERIEKYDFVEGQDFVVRFPNLESEIRGGQNRKEYFLSIDMAKELSMVENNEKGKKARQYFISIEKKSKELMTKPLSPLEVLKQQIMLMEAMEQRQTITESKVNKIEAKLTSRNENMFSIAGYAALQGIKVTTTQAPALGRKATKLSKEKSYPVDKTYDPRFGNVGIYHTDILLPLLENFVEECK